MKFIVDECLKPRLRDLLNDAGHDGVRTPEDQAATLLNSLEGITEDLEAGAMVVMVVLTDDRVRVRRLPI